MRHGYAIASLSTGPILKLDFQHLEDELRVLFLSEVEQQFDAIKEELESLGHHT